MLRVVRRRTRRQNMQDAHPEWARAQTCVVVLFYFDESPRLIIIPFLKRLHNGELAVRRTASMAAARVAIDRVALGGSG